MPSYAERVAYFKPRAVWAMVMLQHDFPEWGPEDAAADLGNAGAESGGMMSLQEIKPTIPGSAGGFGWYQWTGPRRVEYEAYCKRNKFDPRDDVANYKFHFLELRGSEKHTVAAVAKAHGLEAKTVAFERAYERAGITNYPARLAWAKIALAEYKEREAAGTLPKITILPDETEKESDIMDGVKNFLTSKTIWGVLVMLAPVVGKLIGLDIDGGAVSEAQTGVSTIVQGVGALLAIWGRVTAKKTLTIGPPGQ